MSVYEPLGRMLIMLSVAPMFKDSTRKVDQCIELHLRVKLKRIVCIPTFRKNANNSFCGTDIVDNRQFVIPKFVCSGHGEINEHTETVRFHGLVKHLQHNSTCFDIGNKGHISGVGISWVVGFRRGVNVNADVSSGVNHHGER